MTNSTQKMGDLTIADILSRHTLSHIDYDLALVDNPGELIMPIEPRRIDCLLFAMCTEGSVHYVVDTVEQTVGPGDVIIIGNGQTVSDSGCSDDCRGIVMLVSPDFFDEMVKDVHELSQLFLFAREYPVYKFTPEEVDNTMKYYSLMKAKVDQTDHHFRRETVRSLFTTMIYDVSNAIYRVIHGNEVRHTRAEKIFIDFLRLVEQNFRTHRKVSWYGHELCISPKYLSETVKVISRRTPNEWIDNYVVLESRVLLRNSTKSIKEIAQELNFSNQSFFGKFFKEHVGVSPQSYRKSKM